MKHFDEFNSRICVSLPGETEARTRRTFIEIREKIGSKQRVSLQVRALSSQGERERSTVGSQRPPSPQRRRGRDALQVRPLLGHVFASHGPRRALQVLNT